MSENEVLLGGLWDSIMGRTGAAQQAQVQEQGVVGADSGEAAAGEGDENRR